MHAGRVCLRTVAFRHGCPRASASNKYGGDHGIDYRAVCGSAKCEICTETKIRASETRDVSILQCSTTPHYFGFAATLASESPSDAAFVLLAAAIAPVQFAIRGEMAEWSKALDSKSSIRLRVSRVRIPISPPPSLVPHRISGQPVSPPIVPPILRTGM